ncbi:MAG: M24 family metallopeptidase [bacterium]|nr:M24 family metallopeptidase [bacterium]
MKKKLKMIKKVLKSNEMLLIDNPQEVYDILDLNESFNSGEYDASMLIGKKDAYVVCDQLIYPRMQNVRGVKSVKGDSFEYLKNNRLFSFEWKKIISENKIIKLGLTNMSLDSLFKEVSTFHFLSPSRTLGRTKEGSEILDIKRLAKVMKNLFQFAEESLEEGVTDVSLRNMIDEKVYSLGCDRRYLPTYVGFDAKSIFPTLSGERLAKGSIVLIDAGIMKNGAGISFSSSFRFGVLNKSKDRIYRIAKDGLDVIASKIFVGSTPAEADKAYREYLTRHKVKSNSMEYSVSFLATGENGEINSVTDQSRFAQNQVVKITSSLFAPSIGGARFESIILVNGKSNETII